MGSFGERSAQPGPTGGFGHRSGQGDVGPAGDVADRWTVVRRTTGGTGPAGALGWPSALGCARAAAGAVDGWSVGDGDAPLGRVRSPRPSDARTGRRCAGTHRHQLGSAPRQRRAGGSATADARDRREVAFGRGGRDVAPTATGGGAVSDLSAGSASSAGQVAVEDVPVRRCTCRGARTAWEVSVGCGGGAATTSPAGASGLTSWPSGSTDRRQRTRAWNRGQERRRRRYQRRFADGPLIGADLPTLASGKR